MRLRSWMKISVCLFSATPSASPNHNTGTSSNPSSSDAVFPLGRGLQSWTTLQSASDALPISDATFRPTKDNKALTHDTVTSPEPDSRPAMLAIFPNGSHARSDTRGGFSFYAPGPQGVDLTTAKEVTFGYSVMFEQGFQFNMGGKLPGLCECSLLVSSSLMFMRSKTVETMMRSRLRPPAAATTRVAGRRD